MGLLFAEERIHQRFNPKTASRGGVRGPRGQPQCGEAIRRGWPWVRRGGVQWGTGGGTQLLTLSLVPLRGTGVCSPLLARARAGTSLGSGALPGFCHLPLVGHLCRAAGRSEGWLSVAGNHTNKALIPCSGEISLREINIRIAFEFSLGCRTRETWGRRERRGVRWPRSPARPAVAFTIASRLIAGCDYRRRCSQGTG